MQFQAIENNKQNRTQSWMKINLTFLNDGMHIALHCNQCAINHSKNILIFRGLFMQKQRYLRNHTGSKDQELSFHM